MIIESSHNGRAYELVDNNGKTYYRGKRFLRPVQHRQREATVFQCYTNETEESSEPAMESDKPTYSAILSRDKKAPITSHKTDVNVNIRLHRPRSAPIEPSDGPKERTATARLPTDCNREQLLNLHDQKLQRRDSLVLNGADLRTHTLRMVEPSPLLRGLLCVCV